MKRLLLITLLVILQQFHSYSQESPRVSQFNRAGQLFNPAFTGIDEYLDVKMGRRQNIGNFEFAPKTTFLTLSTPIKGTNIESSRLNSLRISDPGLYDRVERRSGKKITHGVGALVLVESQGAFTQEKIETSYSMHYKISDQLNLSLGISPGVFRSRVDINKITLEQDGDFVYDAYLANSSLYWDVHLNGGIAVYSPRYFAGYSVLRAYSHFFNVHDQLQDVNLTHGIGHNFMGGYKIQASPQFEVLPGININYVKGRPLLYNINSRLRYQERIWGGLAYQSSGTFSLLAGIVFNNGISLGYSYDYTVKKISNYLSGSHEIVLGFSLFRKDFDKPYFW